jgi:hypothetical protein
LDRATALTLLAKVEGDVIDGEREITRLCQIITQSKLGGVGSTDRRKTALESLRSVRLAQRAQITRRDQLKSMVRRADAEQTISQVRFNATR